MKIRQGFVSNSSTTSFCIYGICLEKDDLLEKIKPEIKEKVDEEYREDVYEIIEEVQDKVSVHSIYDDEIYIGLSFTLIQDDETGAQFKERVKKAIGEFMNIEGLEFGTYQEAWRDG